MNLLIVPLVLAFGAWYLNRTEKTIEQKIAQDRLHEERLQKFFEQMTSLLMNLKHPTKNGQMKCVGWLIHWQVYKKN